jgi:hypothetical protein
MHALKVGNPQGVFELVGGHTHWSQCHTVLFVQHAIVHHRGSIVGPIGGPSGQMSRRGHMSRFALKRPITMLRVMNIMLVMRFLWCVCVCGGYDTTDDLRHDDCRD